MRRVFIDTNILIDFIENRQGADAAEQVLERSANSSLRFPLFLFFFASLKRLIQQGVF